MRIVTAGVIALATQALLWGAAAWAAPIRCSNEQATCIAACKASAPAATLSVCITNCGQRQAMCVKTGCWDSGASRYCGLLRQ